MRILLSPTLALTTLVFACGMGGSTGSSGSDAGVMVLKAKSATVAGKSETVLADKNGRTLYYFTPDTASKVACSGACEQAWPALTLASGKPAASGSLPGSISTLTGPNGRQVLYNGHPLYRFAKDKASSDVMGQGLFGKWFVATPSLTALPGAATPSPSNGGGYGYGY